MKTQEILTRVNAAMAIVPKDEAYAIPGTIYGELSSLASDLEAQIRLECASERGSANATRTIVKMLNRCKKESSRTSLHYAWTDSDGRQCVCDSYRAFRLNEPLPLEPRPADAGDPIDLDNIIPDRKDYAATPLPSAKEIKAFIAIERAKAGGKRGTDVIWDFGEGKPAVNAEYLLDLVQVFPDATEIFHGVGTKLLSVLYARCDAGEAVLLPVRTKGKIAEMAQAQVAQDEANRAIKAQAEAEGRDPEYIKERMERHAKAKAKAEKELADRLAWIRAETSRNEDYSVEPDEFEYLVYLMDEIKRNAA